MSLAALTARMKYMLNHMAAAARNAKLGDRMSEYETFGTLTHDYAGAHADKTYTEDDLPITQVVCIMLTNADAAANLILPALLRKAYIIYNNSGQTITAKVAGQAGTALANNGRYLCATNGTDIVTFQPEVTLAGTQTLINKTLTTPIVASLYQDAGKTKLMTVPNVASDTFAMLGATQTMVNKTLTSPTINTPVISDPDTTLGVASHDYAGAAVAWTLSAAELKKGIIRATNANGAVNAIVANTANKLYWVINGTGHALTVKTAAGTGIVVANGKSAMVMSDGVNVIRLTTDA
jgi:hypothetical protein